MPPGVPDWAYGPPELIETVYENISLSVTADPARLPRPKGAETATVMFTVKHSHSVRKKWRRRLCVQFAPEEIPEWYESPIYEWWDEPFVETCEFTETALVDAASPAKVSYAYTCHKCGASASATARVLSVFDEDEDNDDDEEITFTAEPESIHAPAEGGRFWIVFKCSDGTYAPRVEGAACSDEWMSSRAEWLLNLVEIAPNPGAARSGEIVFSLVWNSTTKKLAVPVTQDGAAGQAPDPVDPDAPFVSPGAKTLLFSADAQSGALSVYSNAAWTARIEPAAVGDFAQLLTADGEDFVFGETLVEGDGSVRVRIAENETGAARSGEIVFSLVDAEADTCTDAASSSFVQRAGGSAVPEPDPDAPRISLSAENLAFGFLGGAAELTVSFSGISDEAVEHSLSCALPEFFVIEEISRAESEIVFRVTADKNITPCGISASLTFSAALDGGGAVAAACSISLAGAPVALRVFDDALFAGETGRRIRFFAEGK